MTEEQLIRIVVVTPAPPRSRHGNRTTALRWSLILRRLGHRVRISCDWNGEACDVLIALHARKSSESIHRFAQRHPGRPLIVALTGTDLYVDLPESMEVRQSLELATKLVVLQPLAAREVPAAHREKLRVIYQSVPRREPLQPRRDSFEVCVLAHLRPVKDPFRAALASRLVPEASRLRVLQVGMALNADMEVRALAESQSNRRYRWLGDLPRWKALRVLARCRLMVLSSTSEGGANVVSEALACSVPILASRIPGNLGLLGENYPGTFAVGDERELARLLWRAESDQGYYRSLREHCEAQVRLISPESELEAWRRLLGDL